MALGQSQIPLVYICEECISDLLMVSVTLVSAGSDSGQVMINNQPVCDEGWDDEDAGVLCRMLGFGSGQATSGRLLHYHWSRSFQIMGSHWSRSLVDTIMAYGRQCRERIYNRPREALYLVHVNELASTTSRSSQWVYCCIVYCIF